MQDMIKRILDADNEAKQLEQDSRRQAETQKATIEQSAQEMYESCMKEALETVRKNDEAEEKKSAAAWKEISEHQQSVMIKLKADFENNRHHWVDEIVSRVIEA